jgi:DNA-binding MarR family transcriptional regulator
VDKRIYFLLNVATQALRKSVDDEAVERTGLTSAQMGVLQFVAQHDGCTLGELAAGVGVKPAAITGLVARTVKTGCVRTQASRDDGRATQVYLTARGRERVAEIRDLGRELNRRLYDGFSEAELDTVRRFLQHVLTNVVSKAT